jgi:ATP-dependent RNA helicase DDX21
MPSKKKDEVDSDVEMTVDEVAAKAAKKAKKEAKKALLAAEAESVLRDGKVLHPATGSPKLQAVKKSPRLAAQAAPKSPALSALTAPAEEKKASKKRKAESDVQDPAEEEMSLNVKKVKKEEPAAAAASTNPADLVDANGNKPLKDFNISSATQQSLVKAGITHMFPIQAATFDIILSGQDVVGRARTGTGKTLAFALPIVERMLADLKNGASLAYGRAPRVLVLTPTRELAMQIQKTFDMIKGPKLQTTCVYGGSAYGPQEGALRKGMDVVVGTCGRIKDLLEKGTLKLDKIAYVIMDEADEMLNMGFADDVELILTTVPRGSAAVEATATSAGSAAVAQLQTLLFSATIPTWVENVARKYLRPDRKNIDLVGNTQQHANSDISHFAMPCHWSERNSVLGEVIQVYGGPKARVIIFTETKKEANELLLEPSIKGAAAALHGDIPQAQRENTLKGFRDGKFSILIATDVAARGLDIDGVQLVIQCEPPERCEDYIHRSGRTGRANKKGTCITFFTPKQLYYIQNIETRAKVKLVRVPVPQQSDMIKSSVQQAVKAVCAVSNDVVPFFLDAARALLAEAEGAAADGEAPEAASEKVLARALAKIAGFTEAPKSRSLLTSASGMVTAQVTLSGGGEIRSLSFIWQLIRRYISEDCDEKVKGIRMLADRTGAAFDLPQEYEEKVKTVDPQDKRVKFAILTALPQMVEMDVGRPEPKWRGGGGRSGGGGGGFSRGGGGGGRGGGGFRGGRR